MRNRRSIGLIVAALFVLVANSMRASSGEPGTPKRLVGGPAVISYSVPPNSFLGGTTVAEADGTAVACYGILKLNNKPRYTYLILFKADPKKHKGGGIGMGDLPGKGDKGRKAVFSLGDMIEADLPVWVACGEATFEFEYKLKVDTKAGTVVSESIKIGGKDYEKDIPHVFLVDLTNEKHDCVAIKTTQPLPVADGSAGLEKLEQAIRQLKSKNSEVKKFFEGKAKK